MNNFQDYADKVAGSVASFVGGIMIIALVIASTIGILYWTSGSGKPLNFVRDLDVKDISVIQYDMVGERQGLRPHFRVITPEGMAITKKRLQLENRFKNGQKFFMKKGRGLGATKFICFIDNEREQCTKIKGGGFD